MQFIDSVSSSQYACSFWSGNLSLARDGLMRWNRLMRTLFSLSVVFSISQQSLGDEQKSYVRDKMFQQEINRPLISSGLQERPLREFLNELTSERPIAVLLDRRIDPSQKVSTNLSVDYFDDGIQQIAEEIGADISIIADTIVIGPPETTRSLRTRVALLREELKQSSLSVKRQFALLREIPIVWEDLATPQELLESTAKKYDVTIENIDEVPHDLWAAGAISDANFPQAMTILLSQFNLSFEWIDESSVRIVPAPTDSFVTETHRPKGMTVAEASKLVRQSLTHAKVRIDNETLKVTGTIEDQERVAELIGRRPPRVRPVSQLDPNSVANRRYTLTMVRQPFGGLLQLLQQNELTLKYDADKFQAAGVDLKQKISMKFEQATLEQMLDEACKQVGLDYRISGTTIELLLPE